MLTNSVSELVMVSNILKDPGKRVAIDAQQFAQRVSGIGAATSAFMDTCMHNLKLQRAAPPEVNEHMVHALFQLRRAVRLFSSVSPAACRDSNEVHMQVKALLHGGNLLLGNTMKAFNLDDTFTVSQFTVAVRSVHAQVHRSRVCGVSEIGECARTLSAAVVQLANLLVQRRQMVVDENLKSRMETAENVLRANLQAFLKGAIEFLRADAATFRQLREEKNRLCGSLTASLFDILHLSRESHKNIFAAIPLDLYSGTVNDCANFVSDSQSLQLGAIDMLKNLAQAVLARDYQKSIACLDSALEQLQMQVEIAKKASASFEEEEQNELEAATEGESTDTRRCSNVHAALLQRLDETLVKPTTQQLRTVVDAWDESKLDTVPALCAQLEAVTQELTEATNPLEQQLSALHTRADQQLQDAMQALTTATDSNAVFTALRNALKATNRVIAIGKASQLDPGFASSFAAAEIRHSVEALTSLASSIVTLAKRCIANPADSASLLELSSATQGILQEQSALITKITTHTEDELLMLTSSLYRGLLALRKALADPALSNTVRTHKYLCVLTVLDKAGSASALRRANRPRYSLLCCPMSKKEMNVAFVQWIVARFTSTTDVM
eukprot:TRINITY_DN3012_c0_g2_i2.p1 TRINITY_DN3012_c0_g2~~TRINITY_DN3012_c0_g2_i2.p1  ORF type:complete len:646 (+),score=168.40 TRINITY_DN3012_c0_g2_i2:97-1938(+)